MPLFSKKDITSVFRLYVLLHALVMVEYINKGTLNLMVSSKSAIPGEKMIFPNRWLYIINALYVSIASYRVIVAYSPRTTLAQMALYVWPIELGAKIVYMGYRAGLLKPDTPTLLPAILSEKVMLMDIGALLLVGPGLKLLLDETRASDERALQARKEVVEGLDKDQKESERGGQSEEDEDEPLSLADALHEVVNAE
ncbi:MAG: hypothetical protein J3R72DRAFT_101639 [Linnemannia gamsii]|nr:MAG: hypothetical protein J3R72DRAFT_101639 [Linnemannia gamsii]